MAMQRDGFQLALTVKNNPDPKFCFYATALLMPQGMIREISDDI